MGLEEKIQIASKGEIGETNYSDELKTAIKEIKGEHFVERIIEEKYTEQFEIKTSKPVIYEGTHTKFEEEIEYQENETQKEEPPVYDNPKQGGDTLQKAIMNFALQRIDGLTQKEREKLMNELKFNPVIQSMRSFYEQTSELSTREYNIAA